MVGFVESETYLGFSGGPLGTVRTLPGEGLLRSNEGWCRHFLICGAVVPPPYLQILDCLVGCSGSI